jgi:hypothetical protein
MKESQGEEFVPDPMLPLPETMQHELDATYTSVDRCFRGRKQCNVGRM